MSRKFIWAYLEGKKNLFDRIIRKSSIRGKDLAAIIYFHIEYHAIQDTLN